MHARLKNAIDSQSTDVLKEVHCYDHDDFSLPISKDSPSSVCHAPLLNSREQKTKQKITSLTLSYT
ncbi:hypothetical protein Hanom_Chr04g00332851 [Helianthus anomalus]